MQEILLDVEQITKVYGHQTILDRVSFSIHRGEVVGLVGQNGAGKTTLIRILSGLASQDSGEIKQKQDYKVGALIESPVLYANMSAYDNLVYAATQIGMEKNRGRIEEVLALVGLSQVDHKKKVKDYSLGMRQRLAIALAILDFPDFLILDEPVNGLDPAGIKEMRDIIHYLRDYYGMTVLISSHILSELELVVDRFVILHKGNVIKDIDKDQLKLEVSERICISTTDNQQAEASLRRFGIESILVGDQLYVYNDQTVHELILKLVNEPFEITDIYHITSSFEDYYLGLLD